MKTEIRTNNLTATALAIVREAHVARQVAVIARILRAAVKKS